jgi:acetoin utilization deacetylase AcuC-like enzyme
MKLVYSDAMSAPAQGYSPSAAKPAVVVADWMARWPRLELRAPAAATRIDLCRAHAPRYVDNVLDLRAPNGFGTRSAEVAASLPYTTGALLTAARWALADQAAVAAPVSGFHHATWDEGHGFCTFNGLMVTALTLQAEQPGLRVGILDYDYHYGDGTADIIERLKPANLVHITAGARWTEPGQAEAFLANIAEDLASLSDCDLVLYQAGADPHIDDPLGGFLTTTQLAMRDWHVFAGLRERGIPVAWTLAGGYQSPLSKVVTIHENTFRACVTADRTIPFADAR